MTTVLVILIELATRIGLGCFKINHEDEIIICHHFYGKLFSIVVSLAATFTGFEQLIFAEFFYLEIFSH